MRGRYLECGTIASHILRERIIAVGAGSPVGARGSELGPQLLEGHEMITYQLSGPVGVKYMARTAGETCRRYKHGYPPCSVNAPSTRGTQPHSHNTDTQTHRHTDTQTHQHAATQQPLSHARHTDTQTRNYSPTHAATQPHSHTATQPHSHTATQPHSHTATQPHSHIAT